MKMMNKEKTLNKKIKLIARYIVLIFFMYLAYDVTRPVWLAEAKGLDPTTISAIVVAVFGALTLVLKSHFETKVDDDNVSK